MSDNDGGLHVRELDVREKELDLRQKELDLRSEELESKKVADRRMFSSPLAVAVWGLVASISATGAGVIFQNYSNARLETQRSESGLIQKALEDPDKRQAVKNLMFLLDSGAITELNQKNIVSLAKDSTKTPFFGGAALRDGLITVSRAKEILKNCGIAVTSGDNNDDPAFHQAIAKFQLKQGLKPDGLLGPETLKYLWWATPELAPRPTQASAAEAAVTVCQPSP
jgi:murein L,D-transpeptidase YcbB/YkuD